MQGEEPHRAAARSDAELMEAAARGDRVAFSEVVRRHGGAVFRVAGAVTRDASRAEDVAQESLLAAFEAAGTWRGEGSLRAWLSTIARNTALRRSRATPVEETDPASLAELGAAAGWGQPAPDPEAEAIESERRDVLRRALASLEPADRAIIELRDLGGHSTAETAELLGITAGAAKVRLHRARLRLMARLEEGARHGA